VSGAVRWPLWTLHRVRQRASGAARAALGAACAGEARARAERERWAGELSRHARARAHAEAEAGPLGGLELHRVRLVGGEERDAAEGPPWAIADLQVRARHLARLRAEELTLAAGLAGAGERLAEASRQAGRARSALAAARSAVEVLERHRDAWADALRRRRERGEESAEDDRPAGSAAAGSAP